MSDPEEPARRSPVEQVVERAVDAFVYAPIGLIFDGATVLPELVAKGRNQVTVARMMGQFAVTQGRDEAEKVAVKVQDGLIGILERFGQATGAPPAAGPSPLEPQPRSPAPGPGPAVADPSPPVDAADRAAGAGIDAASLSIPDYDGLSASHVVNRLAGLSAAELEAVRLYELAHRGRKTILSKVAQLQAG